MTNANILISGRSTATALPVAIAVDENGKLILTDESGSYIGVVTTPSEVIEITLTLDTNPYAQNDILAATQEISNALRSSGDVSILHSLSIIDKSGNDAAIDILFLRSNTSVGTENAAENMSDNTGQEILTEVQVIATDYIDYANFSRATKVNGDEGMGQLLYATSGTSLYIAAVYRDAAGNTYAANDIIIKIGLLQV